VVTNGSVWKLICVAITGPLNQMFLALDGRIDIENRSSDQSMTSTWDRSVSTIVLMHTQRGLSLYENCEPLNFTPAMTLMMMAVDSNRIAADGS
jgi:hypothetical protein